MNSKRDWEDLAKCDALWSIIPDKSKKYGKWTMRDFFENGQIETANLIDELSSKNYLLNKNTVLDYGCGVGRLAKVFSSRFDKYIGVDISEGMIEKAKTFNNKLLNCNFYAIDETRPLAQFGDNYFDFIYSFAVLQNIPDRSIIKLVIKEFVRSLKPQGLAYFQLTSHMPIKKRIQPRRRAYQLLRDLGLSSNFLYNKLKLAPISTNYISVEDVKKLCIELKADILEIEHPKSLITTYLIRKSGNQ